MERGSAALERALAACEAAARAGDAVLAGGGNALDAVEAAVRVLEDAPGLNAGRGSYRNIDGIVEMDARSWTALHSRSAPSPSSATSAIRCRSRVM